MNAPLLRPDFRRWTVGRVRGRDAVALPNVRDRGAAEAQDPPRVERLVAKTTADLVGQVNASLLGVPADCLVGVEYEIETFRAESIGAHNAMVVRRC